MSNEEYFIICLINFFITKVYDKKLFLIANDKKEDCYLTIDAYVKRN